MYFQDLFYIIAQWVETLSFGILIYGSLLAVYQFIKNEIFRLTGKFKFTKLNEIRVTLGNYILIGLVFLISADIIETIIKPELSELIELAGIVVIRILLSYFLGKEINELKESNSGKESERVKND